VRISDIPIYLCSILGQAVGDSTAVVEHNLSEYDQLQIKYDAAIEKMTDMVSKTQVRTLCSMHRASLPPSMTTGN
jgi:hypothetical protein